MQRSYNDLNSRVMELYGSEAYGEALALLMREGNAFPDQAPAILYLRSCLAARIGRIDESIGFIQEALDRGFWYGEEVMRESPSWKSLQGMPDFERLVAICTEREARAPVGPGLLTLEPTGEREPGRSSLLYIALHGNGANASEALEAWRPVVAEGWLLAAPQASRPMATDMYAWDDQETVVPEVEEQYRELLALFPIDTSQVVLAGFSMGAETALRLALRHRIAARGFILLGPAGPTVDTPSAWLPLLQEGTATGVRGYLMLGENDTAVSRDAIDELVDLLNRHGIPCELEILSGLGHEYPPDIVQHLTRALAFVQDR